VNIHRYYYPNQIVFITQIVNRRKALFDKPNDTDLLVRILKKVKVIHPFSMLAYVFMPDHFHILIRPTGQSNFSQIMHSIKLNFTHAYKQNLNYKGSLILWQKRFWDHIIRDEKDLENHIHYIHYNPVKHGFVNDMGAWKFSSFSIWQDRGLYGPDFNWEEPNIGAWGE